MRIISLIVASILIAGTALADTVVLRDGGSVKGNVTVTATEVVVDIRPGMQVSFPKEKVKEIIFEKTPREKFEERFSRVEENDAEGFYELGFWAKERGLAEEATKCFRKVVEIMPDHAGARKQLGHVRYEGEWVPYDEAMKAKGLVEYDGKWVTPGEKKELQKQDRIKELKKEIKGLVVRLASTDDVVAKKAVEEYMKIEDPLAVPALEYGASHRKPFIRHLTILLYSRFKPELVTGQLVRMAITDDDERIRGEAAGALRQIKSTSAYIALLKNFYFNPDGDIRLYSMEALQALKDKNSVKPLIESIAFEVKRVVTVPERLPDTFVGTQSRKVVGLTRFRDATGGVVEVPVIGTVTSGFGGGGTEKVINDVVFNLGARLALKEITGQDFNYDKNEWRQWWEENADDFGPFMEEKDPDD